LFGYKGQFHKGSYLYCRELFQLIQADDASPPPLTMKDLIPHALQSVPNRYYWVFKHNQWFLASPNELQKKLKVMARRLQGFDEYNPNLNACVEARLKNTRKSSAPKTRVRTKKKKSTSSTSPPPSVPVAFPFDASDIALGVADLDHAGTHQLHQAIEDMAAAHSDMSTPTPSIHTIVDDIKTRFNDRRFYMWDQKCWRLATDDEVTGSIKTIYYDCVSQNKNNNNNKKKSNDNQRYEYKRKQCSNTAAPRRIQRSGCLESNRDGNSNRTKTSDPSSSKRPRRLENPKMLDDTHRKATKATLANNRKQPHPHLLKTYTDEDVFSVSRDAIIRVQLHVGRLSMMLPRTLHVLLGKMYTLKSEIVCKNKDKDVDVLCMIKGVGVKLLKQK
jgi:hypothetical protein